MQFSNVRGAVSLGLQDMLHAWDCIWHSDAVTTNAQGGRISAAEHAHTAGHASRATDKGVVKGDSIVCQRIKVWCEYFGIAVCPKAISALLVSVDEKNVGPFHELVVSQKLVGELGKLAVAASIGLSGNCCSVEVFITGFEPWFTILPILLYWLIDSHGVLGR